MKRFTLAVATVSGLSLCVCLVPTAQGHTDPKALRGLSKCQVIIESLPKEATACGITEDRLKTLAETALMEAGIKVVPNTGPEDAYAYVYIRVGCLPQEGDLVYDCDLEARVSATRADLMTKFMRAHAKTGVTISQLSSFASSSGQLVTIWDTGTLAYAGTNRLPDAIYQTVGENLDQLKHDFLMVKQNQ